ncbi:MAG: hypothetical protein PVI06_07050 [Desulfobacterales bacterium]
MLKEIQIASHPAAGPLTPLQTLEPALIHFDNHCRRIHDHLEGRY